MRAWLIVCLLGVCLVHQAISSPSPNFANLGSGTNSGCLSLLPNLLNFLGLGRLLGIPSTPDPAQNPNTGSPSNATSPGVALPVNNPGASPVNSPAANPASPVNPPAANPASPVNPPAASPANPAPDANGGGAAPDAGAGGGTTP